MAGHQYLCFTIASTVSCSTPLLRAICSKVLPEFFAALDLIALGSKNVV
jgi:hypothetical protein